MNKRILTSLDSWLDTRLGTVHQLNPKAAEVIMANRDYWVREHTDWSRLTGGLISNEQFEAKYATRDLTTLQHSIVTGLLAPMLKVISDYDLNVLHGMGHDEVTLEVNLWPYELDADYVEILEGVFRELFGPSQRVTWISIPMEELTPTLMVERYSMTMFYEFHQWMKVHASTLYNGRHTSFSMVGPKLFETDPVSLSMEERQLELQRFHRDHLAYMHFEFIDAKHFSVFRP